MRITDNWLGFVFSLLLTLQAMAADSADALREKAEKGDATAQSDLGAMYAAGDGVAKDEAEAVKWWRKAAEQGDALAQYNLGNMYADGRGVPKNAIWNATRHF